jgi:alkylated DNA repair dioxygenase AlkB
MNFERYSSTEKASIILAPHSLLVLSGESRYDWMHSIPPRKTDMLGEIELPRTRRVSLTFRKTILS